MSLNKELANLFAQAALQGIALHQLPDDRGRQVFIATRDEMTVRFDTVTETRDWLSRLKKLKDWEKGEPGSCLSNRQSPDKPGTSSGLRVESDSTR